MRMSLYGARLTAVHVTTGAHSVTTVPDCHIVPVTSTKYCPYTDTAQPAPHPKVVTRR